MTEWQLEQWVGRKLGPDLRLEGPCPACRHLTRGNVPTTTTAFEGGTANTETDLTVALVCNCGCEHPGQLDVPLGCGRSWTATARSNADGSVGLSPQNDPYLAEAALAFRSEQNGQTERLRAAGEKWIAGIAAIIGIIGLIGFSAEVPNAERLTTVAKWTIAGLALGGILAGVAAVYRAYQAAYGWPRTRVVGTDDELIEWYAASRDVAGRLVARLRQAAALASFSVLTLTITFGLIAFLPPAELELTDVQVTLSNRSTICGDLLTSNREGALLIRQAENGQTEFVPLAEIFQVALAKNC